MNRRCFLAVLLVVVSACAAHAAARPNVLLIAFDDLNTNLGCYGHPLVKSPSIDALAARGVRFDRAYCQYPVCNPSRVSLLSGRRPDATKVMDLVTPPRTHLPGAVFLPEYFRQQGYYTAHVGKIFHTGDTEDPPSWDLEIRERGKQPPEAEIIRKGQVERPLKYGLTWYELKTPDADTADGLVARTAAAMLKDRARQAQPFFLGIGFRRPHSPYAAPSKYFAMYPPTTIPPLVEPVDHLAGIPAAALTYPLGTPRVSEAERQQVVAAYWACISYADAQLGVVMQALDDLDLWKNTVIVLYGDHGYHLGEHGGMWHKMSLFEESARVPLVIVAPGAKGNGDACTRVVEFVDIYPTLVDLCGLPTVEGLAGTSLRPLLNDPSQPWSQAGYTQVVHGGTMGRSIRTERWRYTEWDDGRAGRQLYDHDADPHEYVNLAQQPDLANVVAELSQRLRASKASSR
jgi:uncharacterized sulfatase